MQGVRVVHDRWTALSDGELWRAAPVSNIGSIVVAQGVVAHYEDEQLSGVAADQLKHHPLVIIIHSLQQTARESNAPIKSQYCREALLLCHFDFVLLQQPVEQLGCEQ